MSDVTAMWKRIEQWLIENDGEEVDPEDGGPEVILESYLNEGASADDVSNLERTLEISLPADVRASLERHDGTQGVLIDGYWQLLSISDIARRVQQLRARWREDDPIHESAQPGPGVRRFHDHPLWIEIAHDNGSGYVAVDLNPNEGGQLGQLIVVRADTDGRKVIAPTFTAWLETFCSGLDAGRFEADGTAVYRA